MSDNKFEMVENVKLDLTDYSGKDLYSEGEMENLLLQLVKDNEEASFNKLIAQNQYWSVLYHLSHIRGNVVDFIPLKKGDKVLEVGAGCGAITSALAKSGADITCIELSKQRSLINAYRNKTRDNIEIKVGNFEDIEKRLDNDFDYIFMIGVFEYGGAYITSEDPYMDFLRKLYSHLNSNGVVYMAIENKMGMKYLAGCREDHTGRFYEGIEGYQDKKGVKTFTKKKLESMAKAAGFDAYFMYPYPDYKLPFTIYSEERLPKVGEIGNNLLNFDNSRVVAFDEVAAFDEAISEGEFGRYSNSFLLKLSKGESAESFSARHIVYSKHSNDRDDSLKIRTDIEKDGYGKLYVVKRPCTELANEHIIGIKDSFDKFSDACKNSSFSVNECVIKSSGALSEIEFPYVEGKTLEELFDEYFECCPESELKEKVNSALDKYVDAIKTIDTVNGFSPSEKFLQIFGEHLTDTNQDCFRVSNIDLIFTNIFTDVKNTIIDYEWTFDFSVPVKFVLYRALFYYFSKDDKRKEFLEKNCLYEKYGISDDEKAIFEEWEHNFQLYIAGSNVSLTSLHSIFGQDAYKLDDMVAKESILGRKWRVCVYYDKGTGFNQEDTIYYKANVDADTVTLKVPVCGAKELRIDPTDEPCMLKLQRLSLCKGKESQKVSEVLVNGIYLSDEIIYYKDFDPQFIIQQTQGYDYLEIEYSIIAFRRDFFEALAPKLSTTSGILSKKKGPYEKIRLS